MVDRPLDHFERVRHRGQPYWWLMAQEERHNDVFLLRRLTGEQMRRVVEEDDWPPDFDRYETLLRLGREAGHRVVFVDPVGDSSLAWSMRDLALERPGIQVSELAALLNLGTKTATTIAREAVIKHGVEIVFDTEEENRELRSS